MIPKQLRVKGINFVLIEKGCKKPYQTEWQNKKIEFDSVELVNHLKNEGNYGVLGGGEKNLLMVDFDDKNVQKDALIKLPETFTVKTGSGMFHLYYFSNNKDSFKGFDEQMNTLFDVQGEKKQCIGAGSLHPNGNRYEIFNDKDIAFIDYAELKAILMPYDKRPKKKIEIRNEESNNLADNFLDNLIRKVLIKDVLNYLGVDTSRNPTHCPFHDSKGGKCFSFNDETAHCFHCEGSWNVISLIKDSKKCSSRDAIGILASIGGMEQELEDSRERYFKMLHLEKDNNKLSLVLEIVGLLKDKKIGDASEKLVDYVKENLQLYTTKDDLNTEMWVYKDGIYVPQGKSEVKELLRGLLGKVYSAWLYNQVIAKIEIDTFIDIDKFFKTKYPNEIALENGILNIRTLKITPFSSKKIFFNKMPVKFNDTAKCPKIDKFLREVLANEEDVNVFYELCGFALLDEYKFEKAFMFHGEGRNGKGKTIELIKRLFGIDNCCSVPLHSLKGEDFSISELFGKRLNLAGDIGSQDLKETNMFKSLTGRDLVSGKRKFLRNINFENNSKFVFACNELPMVYDLTRGFWDRWILLDFPFTFVTQEELDKTEDKNKLKIKDDEIINKITLPDELSGLLNEALLGLNRLEKNKKFSATRGSEEIKQVWVRRSNSFIAFCFDNIIDEYNGRIGKKILRKRYSEYCKKHKVAPKSDFITKKVLQENYGAIEVRANDFLGVRDDIWEGISWKQ